MTAVQWLIDRIDISSPFMISDDDIKKAIEMEKQQIINAHISGYDSSGGSATDYYDYYYTNKIKS